MKKILLNLTFLLAIATFASTKDEKVAATPDNANNPNAPEITF